MFPKSMVNIALSSLSFRNRIKSQRMERGRLAMVLKGLSYSMGNDIKARLDPDA